MGIRRIVIVSAICLLAGIGFAVAPAAHATAAGPGYNCASVTTYPQLSGPGSGLGETVSGTNCTALNGAPTSGAGQVSAGFYADGVFVVTCTKIILGSYPSLVGGWHCTPQ
jgi:hypothetical protein